MKELKDLGLTAKDELKVKAWLNEWMLHFTKMADGAKGTVERYNLEDLDFFYFTDCRDVLNKNPESKGVESNKQIMKRKRAVEYQLIFRKLLGEQLGKNRPCSHCGNGYRWINSLGDGTGHYVFCPKCFMTTVVTYPIGYDTCIKRINEDIQRNLKSIILANRKVTGEHLDLSNDLTVHCTTKELNSADASKRYESGTQNNIQKDRDNSLGTPYEEDEEDAEKPKRNYLDWLLGNKKGKKGQKRCTGDCKNCKRHAK